MFDSNTMTGVNTGGKEKGNVNWQRLSKVKCLRFPVFIERVADLGDMFLQNTGNH